MEKIKQRVFLVKEKTDKCLTFVGTDQAPHTDYPGLAVLHEGSWETFDLCQDGDNITSVTLSAINQAFTSSATGRSCIHLFVVNDKKSNVMRLSARMVLDDAIVKALSNLLAEPKIIIRGTLHNTPFNISELDLQAISCVESIDGSSQFIQDKDGYSANTRFGLNYSIILEWAELKMTTLKERSTVLDTLFNEKLLSDCFIVTDDGAEVSCHKSILAANSDVLRGIVTSPSQSNRIDMGTISSQVVNLLVAYVYGQEINVEDMTEAVAFELLQAAHKYHITPLEKLMMVTLFNRPDDKFDMNIVLDLYRFTLGEESLNELCKKMLNILKRNPKQLLDSDAYKGLMEREPKEDAELALKLLELVIN